ncbi:MAG: adenylosuccinate lyase [Bacteroidales bacterium]|nr:adenylosuccinate lyase [Bacteroidales bacterium]MBS3773801.1 adenylosuccinate lyase [Bacteroidales bacterium]
MDLNALTAISPIDGRYRRKTEETDRYFSEFGLIKYRIRIEMEYFIHLCLIPLPELKSFNHEFFEPLRRIYKNFDLKDAEKIKEIEKETNHDVKAVEYFLKEQFIELGLKDYKEFIHFGLTSQDINNTATPLSLKDAFNNHYLPHIESLLKKLDELSREWKDIPMLAHTHGQPASPTRVGKEIRVFYERLNEQMRQLKQIPFSAKFGGATGNFNAHHLAYPEIDWEAFADNFVNKGLGLERSKITTQIEHYDNLASFFHGMCRINTILTDLSRDMWSYISMNYFKQKIKKGEVGSSVMPHKVNPIDFENAEGNLGMANAILEHMASKLPISRLQRDLTDSTVSRNIGVPFAHTLIAFQSLTKGLNKITLNKEAIDRDLEENWSVVAEAIQTMLRKEGIENPYELLKHFTRKNKQLTQNDFIEFIDQLDVNESVREKLKKISPWNYTGLDYF